VADDLFIDPTPLVETEGKTSFCTVVSVGAESTTTTGKAGIVSFKGKQYPATLIGAGLAAGSKCHFIQTGGMDDEQVRTWGVKFGTYYQTIYPKPGKEWADKNPAALALLEMLKENPREKTFQTGILKSSGATPSLLLGGKAVSVPAKFATESKIVPVVSIGKHCLVFLGKQNKHVIVHTAPLTTNFNITAATRPYIRGGLTFSATWPDTIPVESLDALAAEKTQLQASIWEMAAACPVAAIESAMVAAGYTGFKVASFSAGSTSIDYPTVYTELGYPGGGTTQVGYNWAFPSFTTAYSIVGESEAIGGSYPTYYYY
jgi:hypothetical protein